MSAVHTLNIKDITGFINWSQLDTQKLNYFLEEQRSCLYNVGKLYPIHF